MFKVTKNSRLLSAHKVGEPTGGVLKVIVKILPHESLEEDVDYDIAIPPEGNVPFPIDFFHPAFRTGNEALHLFTIGTFQVRVYLLRG